MFILLHRAILGRSSMHDLKHSNALVYVLLLLAYTPRERQRGLCHRRKLIIVVSASGKNRLLPNYEACAKAMLLDCKTRCTKSSRREREETLGWRVMSIEIDNSCRKL